MMIKRKPCLDNSSHTFTLEAKCLILREISLLTACNDTPKSLVSLVNFDFDKREFA